MLSVTEISLPLILFLIPDNEDNFTQEMDKFMEMLGEYQCKIRCFKVHKDIMKIILLLLDFFKFFKNWKKRFLKTKWSFLVGLK